MPIIHTIERLTIDARIGDKVGALAVLYAANMSTASAEAIVGVVARTEGSLWPYWTSACPNIAHCAVGVI